MTPRKPRFLPLLGSALLSFAFVLWAAPRGEALPTCATLNCSARNYTDACGTHTFVCINEGAGLLYCEEAGVTNVQPAGTPCASDNNTCTTDVCGSYTVSGTTYPSGYCEHQPHPIGEACTDDGNGCTNDVCGSFTSNGMTYPNGQCTHPGKGAGAACPDDGNVCTSDVCDGSSNCTHPAKGDGTACPDDGNVCSSDVCSGGNCAHPALGVNTPCTNDGNVCTSDVCNGAGTCTHNNPTGGGVCGAQCIPPGTCCDNPNSCTGGRTCPAAGGSCGCPSGTFDCAGSCINNGSCCNSPNTCSGGKVCSGVGGSCSCPGGTYDCGGTCVASGTCCNTPNNCSAPANGTSTCPTPGGACQVSCNAPAYKQCGAVCIPSSSCCVDGDCPSDAANHRHGICASNGCAMACDPGYKVCGSTCIANGACCASTDCTSPPNACYKSQGTCTSGTCSYAYNDGAACDADNDKCTPNDKCMSGACVADTAHAVTCVQRDCRSAPTCNKSTGNCIDTNLADGTVCGGNGCLPAGTCTGGACSTASQVTDCSGLNTACRVGLCDPAKPGSGAQKCGIANVPNGTGCSLTDRCLLAPACSGGECVGTQKACAPSGACRIAACNSTTGDCEETVAPVGTSCAIAGSCAQNGSCDATGNCVGDPVPDGTPCDRSGCTTAATCTGGACTCLDSPDFGSDHKPDDPNNTADGGSGSGKAEHGCAVASGHVSGAALLAFALLVLAFVARRPARRAVRVRKQGAGHR